MGIPDKAFRSEHADVAAIFQPVVDYRLDPLAVAYQRLKELVTEFRDDYNRFNFGKGDKFPSKVFLRNHRISDRIELNIPGNERTKFTYALDIPLAKPLDEEVFVNTPHEAFLLVGRADPGGNGFNEARDLAHFMAAGIGPETLHLYSSTDEVFDRWIGSLSNDVRSRINMHILNKAQRDDMRPLESRRALHLDYNGGTISISNPAVRTSPYMHQHLERLGRHTHLMVSEPYGQFMVESKQKAEKLQPPNLKYNPSSAFRRACADDVWEFVNTMYLNKLPALSMNTEEFDYFLRCLNARVNDESVKSSGGKLDPELLQKRIFHAPFGQNDNLSVDPTVVTKANDGFAEYYRYLPVSNGEGLHVELNISDGSHGGFHVVRIGNNRSVVYSTIPSSEGTDMIFKLAGNPPGLSDKSKFPMGAGDSVGSILSLVDIVDIERLMGEYAAAKNKGTDPQYLQTTAILFTSVLSRYVGECLFRSDRCDLSAIPIAGIRPLFDKAADEALKIAEDAWGYGPNPFTAKSAGGIRVAIWQLEDRGVAPSENAASSND